MCCGLNDLFVYTLVNTHCSQHEGVLVDIWHFFPPLPCSRSVIYIGLSDSDRSPPVGVGAALLPCCSEHSCVSTLVNESRAEDSARAGAWPLWGEDGPSVDCQGHLFIHALRKSTQLCALHSTISFRERNIKQPNKQRVIHRNIHRVNISSATFSPARWPMSSLFKVIQSSLRRPREQFPAGAFYLQLHYPEGFAGIIMPWSMAPGVGCTF